MVISKTFKDLKPMLIEGVKTGVKEPYYLIESKEQLIFVVSPGKNGSEFNKTAGYFNSYPGMQTFICLYGSGILVMQRNDSAGEAKEFRVVSISSGKQILVPAGWGMCLVNIGSNFLVVLRNSLLDDKYLDQQPLIDKKGFAYYIVEKKGEIALEQNRHYLVHPQITTE